MLDDSRIRVLEKILEYEKKGEFNRDVENDLETIPLLPNKIDYLSKNFFSKISNKFANRIAISYYERILKKGDFVISDICGVENFCNVKGGAVLTCNHFSVYDNYLVFKAIKKYLGKGKNLYKVIKEGNYTNYKGLFGFFFRHCNTLPLSSNTETMIKFLKSVKILLARGEKILIYPEQAMWWNYKKPRPMKNGAFRLAATNNVPIIPIFITMRDSDKTNSDGSIAQNYTIWILPPIYPTSNLSIKENTEYLKDENYRVWKEVYERVYGVKLVYSE